MGEEIEKIRGELGEGVLASLRTRIIEKAGEP